MTRTRELSAHKRAKKDEFYADLDDIAEGTPSPRTASCSAVLATAGRATSEAASAG